MTRLDRYQKIIDFLIKRRNEIKGKREIHAHSAALVRNDSILKIADNYPIVNRVSAHAEATVLSKINNNKQYDMYVIRTGAGNSRPCLQCLNYMSEANNINHVIYTDGVSISVSNVNKLLNEEHQHISRGQKCDGEEEDVEDAKK